MGAIHDVADVLIHIKAPLICLDGTVQVTGNLIVAGVVVINLFSKTASH